MSTHDYRACPRCGVVREVHLYRETALGMCRDCKLVEPEWPKVEMTGRRSRCGTVSGYYWHVRYRRELACEPCLTAHRAAGTERRRRAGRKPKAEAEALKAATKARLPNGRFARRDVA